MKLTQEEKILDSFANKLFDSDRSKFNSKFIKIYNELKKHFKISQALKAGSLGKNTKIKLYGDLDLTFTFDNQLESDSQKMREIVADKLRISFPKDHIELKNKSIFIKFSSGIAIDVVYLLKDQFEKEKTNQACKEY